MSRYGSLGAAGRLVRWHRERSGWTQTELGARLGISQAGVSQIEHGIGGQAMTALALFVVGAPTAGALIARWPRSAAAQVAIAESRRLARGERRRLRRDTLDLAPAVEESARRERAAQRVCGRCRERFKPAGLSD